MGDIRIPDCDPATTPLSDGDFHMIDQNLTVPNGAGGFLDDTRYCAPPDIAHRALDTEGLPETGGTTITSKNLGNIASGTLTIDVGARKLQHYSNVGAHALSPGGNTGFCYLDITNGTGAGAITTSGWDKLVGSFTTNVGDQFRCLATINSATKVLKIVATIASGSDTEDWESWLVTTL